MWQAGYWTSSYWTGTYWDKKGVDSGALPPVTGTSNYLALMGVGSAILLAVFMG